MIVDIFKLKYGPPNPVFLVMLLSSDDRRRDIIASQW